MEEQIQQEDMEKFKHKFGKSPIDRGVSLKKDHNGFYVSTHRARSDSKHRIDDITDSELNFISSTGAASKLLNKEAQWVPQWAEKLIKESSWEKTSQQKQKEMTSLNKDRLYDQLVKKVRSEDPIETAIQRVLPAVGTIWVQSGQEQWNGSGFLLPNDRFMTAAHVVDGIDANSVIKITFDEKEYFDAKVLKSDKSIDVAILIMNNSPNDVIPLKFAVPNSIKVGEEIAVIGAPSGWHDITTTGRISAINQSVKGSQDPSLQDVILIDADIEGGSSGSPVIDADGNAIGIVMALVGEHADIGIGKKLVVPAWKIVQIME